MKPVLPLLVLCLSLSASRVNSQSTQGTGYQAVPEFCCNTNPGPKVQITSGYIGDIANNSPNYELIATPNFYNQGLDNACHTYFPMGDDTYLRLTSLTFCNGTVVVQKYILGRLTGYPGVGRLQGLAIQNGSSTIVYDEGIIGYPCPGFRAYYRKFIAGSCNVLQDQISNGIDDRHGDANTRCVSDFCLDQFVSIANSQNFCGSDFVLYPNKLNANCVTRFNGISCINADRVPPEDTYTFPSDESSCQTLFY